jgi:hypothetical protein
MTADDVLVVAPYNSQVALLEERIGSKGVRAGTVDRFQGQEAPVVIYSIEPECKTPRWMQLANALCRYVELAQTTVAHGPGGCERGTVSIEEASAGAEEPSRNSHLPAGLSGSGPPGTYVTST